MISHEYANKILNSLVGRDSNIFDKTTNVYLGLCASEPAALNGAVDSEPETEFYVRKQVTKWVKENYMEGQYMKQRDVLEYARFGNGNGGANNGVIMNTEEIQFNTARDGYKNTDGSHQIMHWFFLSTTVEKGTKAFMWGAIKGSPVKYYDADGGCYDADGNYFDKDDVPQADKKITSEELQTKIADGTVKSGIKVKVETVPTFYENQLQISLDVALPVEVE